MSSPRWPDQKGGIVPFIPPHEHTNPHDGGALGINSFASGAAPMAGGAVSTPEDSVVSETTYGQASDAGTFGTFQRGNHTHGTPDVPALDDLSDVDAPTPTDGDVLTWDDYANEWINLPSSGGALALDDLTDVNAPAPSDQDVLTWDNGAGEWIAQAQSAGFSDPMTTRGDIIIRNASNATDRLGVGGAGEVLTSDGTDVSWQPGGTDWTVVTKASDESVSSNTTVQNDDELFFTATSGSMYEFEMEIVYANPVGGGTPDMQYDIGEDGSGRGLVLALYWSTANAAGLLQYTHYQGNALGVGTDTTKRVVSLRGNHRGNGGTFRLRWAQASSSSNATTVYAGSVLRYRVLS